ncbi:MAG: DUF1513 domain-containing protein [Nitratireductor sp.]
MAALLNRRALLAAAGTGLLAWIGAPRALAGPGREAAFAAAYKDRDGRFGVALIARDGAIRARVALPDRGHDIACDRAARRAVAFARRPGYFAVVFDLNRRAEPVTLQAAPGRHFFGHGVFSPDGRLLYATENDFEAARGLIGVYDATDGFRRVGEFDTHGMDPHELLLMPDGRTLAVANGGIETHPDFGRAKLNLATMRPSLVFLDRIHGTLVETHRLAADLYQLSIRHMAVDGSGRCWFGCQYEGPRGDVPPLVGLARPGDAIRLLDLPGEAWAGFGNYVGSVACNPTADSVAVTSPRGNLLATFDAASGELVGRERLEEVCGLAAQAGGFFATAGTGAIRPANGKPEHVDLVWDNHVLRLDG